MRIGIVSGLPDMREALLQALALAPDHQLAWTAGDGVEAVEQCARDRPDLLLMDLIMPRMDGVEATRRIMARTPCAILIVTADIDGNAGRVFAAMRHGALDAVDMPLPGPGNLPGGVQPLLAKIAAITSLIGEGAVRRGAGGRTAPHGSSNALVAIGASAGGPAALAAILRALPGDFPAAVVIVQHVDARFALGLADWLGGLSPLPIRLAREGDRALPGEVLIAGKDDHLIFKSGDRLGYSALPSDQAFCPSVDVFLNSVARYWRGPVIGVLLTGMGSDGAQGLKALRAKGYHTIAQDRATSAVYGMPKAAAAISAAVDILPLSEIAPRLTELLVSAPSRRGAA